MNGYRDVAAASGPAHNLARNGRNVIAVIGIDRYRNWSERASASTLTSIPLASVAKGEACRGRTFPDGIRWRRAPDAVTLRGAEAVWTPAIARLHRSGMREHTDAAPMVPIPSEGAGSASGAPGAPVAHAPRRSRGAAGKLRVWTIIAAIGLAIVGAGILSASYADSERAPVHTESTSLEHRAPDRRPIWTIFGS